MPDQHELERCYEDHVLPSVESPAHRGRLPAPDGVGLARNPACGDQVRIEVVLDADRRIETAVHESRGCLVSRAAAELLCRHVEGLTPDEAEQIGADEVLDLLGVPLTPARRRCGLVAHEALGRLLNDLATRAGRRKCRS